MRRRASCRGAPPFEAWAPLLLETDRHPRSLSKIAFYVRPGGDVVPYPAYFGPNIGNRYAINV